MVWTGHIVFTRSSLDGYLGCFHLSVVVNKACKNTGVQVSFLDPDFNYFGCVPRSGIAGSCLFFWGIPFPLELSLVRHPPPRKPLNTHSSLNQLSSRSPPNPAGTSQPSPSLTHGCYLTQAILALSKRAPHLASGTAATLRVLHLNDLSTLVFFPLLISANLAPLIRWWLQNFYPQLRFHSWIPDSYPTACLCVPVDVKQEFQKLHVETQLLTPWFSQSSHLRKWKPHCFLGGQVSHGRIGFHHLHPLNTKGSTTTEDVLTWHEREAHSLWRSPGVALPNHTSHLWLLSRWASKRRRADSAK